jgi:hypothetical protein
LFLGRHDWQNGNFRVKFAFRKMVRLPRLVALLAALFLALDLSPIQAVILYRIGDVNANTTAPDLLFPHDGWDYEGTWGGFLGTPIAPHFFISAAHIGQAGWTTFTLQTVNYTVLRGFYDPQSDLVIWQVAQTFPNFASLYPRQDEVGQGTVDIGRGTQRGASYSLNSQMLGWLWGPQDGVKRWGQNAFSNAFQYQTNWDLLYATFDQIGLMEECTLSSGDSGGAAFLNDGGTWKLAGINYAVDGDYSESPDGSNPFTGALFDTRGLYAQQGSQWVLVTGSNPVPTGFYPTRISTKLAWIASVVASPVGGHEGNFATLTYTKLTDVPVSYSVEQSTDLVNWTTANTIEETISTNGNAAVVKSKVDMSGLSPFFLRVRTTQELQPVIPSPAAAGSRDPAEATLKVSQRDPSAFARDDGYIRLRFR